MFTVPALITLIAAVALIVWLWSIGQANLGFDVGVLRFFAVAYAVGVTFGLWALAMLGCGLVCSFPPSAAFFSVGGQIFAAFLVLDLLTGIYHLVTDRGWNFRQQVELFQHHHATNTMEGYDWQPLIGAIVGFGLGLHFESPFLIALGVFTVFAQVPHYFAHHPPKRGPVKWLQDAGIIISPEHHAGHHQGEFDQNFCIFTGWNDWWLNRLVRLLPPSR